MSFSVEVKIDSEKLIKRLERKAKADAERKAIFKGLSEGALLIQSTAIKSIQSHKSKGRTYGDHVASRPGYPPNSDTGALVQSIRVALNPNEPSASIGTDLLYGAYLEFGTLDMAPRPWLGPAYRENKNAVVGLVAEALEELKE